MARNLVIVESPAKAKTILKYLGKDYVIKASYGHVRDLPNRTLGVDIEHDFEPTYTPLKDKKKVLKELKTEAKKSDEIYIATDPDREGEAIAWHIYEAIDGKQHKIKRIVFNEITKNAIQNAIHESREIDQNLVDAQQARRILDRLIGYKLSPILSKKIRRGLSAGRVQSVAVRIICEREAEIQAFIPEEFWVIDTQLKTDNGAIIEGKVFAGEDPKQPLSIPDEAAAKAIKSDLEGAAFSIASIQKSKHSRKPYAPFITSTLQQEASKKLNWSAKKTMLIAQQLYEGIEIGGEPVGLITYMRTDSIRLSKEATEGAKAIITKEYGDKYLQQRFFKSKKGAQDAHEAIRPTYPDKKPEDLKDALSTDHLKLYRLIWSRFIGSQMTNAEYERTQIIVRGTNTNTHHIKINGNVMLFDGFTRVYNESKDVHESQDEDRSLPKLQENQSLALEKINSQQKFTQPPHRFTEASLVKTLEEQGIGRPSTYAPTLSTIVDRGYITKEGKTLHPSELGNIVNEQLTKFFNQIIDVHFTAEMETKLDEIMEGKHKWQEIVGEIYSPFSDLLTTANDKMEKIKMDKPSDEICDKCSKPMVIKAGRFGDFLACSDFPTCKNTKSIVVETGVSCPECDGGLLVEKRSRKGKVFYACNNYPACKHALWDKPIPEECPKCNNPFMAVKIQKGGNEKKYCPKCEPPAPRQPKKNAKKSK